MAAQIPSYEEQLRPLIVECVQRTRASLEHAGRSYDPVLVETQCRNEAVVRLRQRYDVETVITESQNLLTNISAISSELQTLAQGGLESVQAGVEDFTAGILDAFDNQVAEVFNAQQGVADAIIFGFESKLRDLSELQSALASKIADSQTELIGEIGAGINQLASTTGGAITALSANVGGALQALIEKQGTTADAVDRLSESLGDSQAAAAATLSSAIRQQGSESENPIFRALEAFFGVTPTGLIAAYLQDSAAFDSIVGGAQRQSTQSRATPLSERASVLSASGVAGAVSPTAGEAPNLFERALSGLFTIIGRMQAVSNADIQSLQQQSNAYEPWRFLELPDVVDAVRRGFLDDNTGRAWSALAGYTPEAIDVAFQVLQEKPPVGELLVWYFRGFINADQLEERLISLGWEPSDAANVISASFPIPPIQDLITMAVREVFTPDIAQTFGQYEDFPDEFARYAEMQGVSQEWAQRYWAAHWQLPSPQMAFEMFHRRIIDKDQLSQLLRALDVMPFWRDRVTEMSYNVLTRVDIRRMHALGMLTDDQVYEHALDFGYSPENAERYRDFVITYNSEVSTIGSEEQRQLTTSQILRAYTTGLLDEAAAKSLLDGLGYGADAVSVLIESEQLKSELDRRDALMGIIEDQVAAGLLAIDEAESQLLSAQFTPEEVGNAIERMRLKQEQAKRFPSKDDIKAMVKAKAITRDEAADALRKLGYVDPWVERLLKTF